MLYFHMNLRCTGFELDYGDGLWGGTRMLYFKDFKGAQKIRNIKPKKYRWWRIDKPKIDFLYNAGWHFRFLGNEENAHNVSSLQNFQSFYKSKTLECKGILNPSVLSLSQFWFVP